MIFFEAMQSAPSFSVKTDINNDGLRPSGSVEGVCANALPKLEAIARGQALVIEVILPRSVCFAVVRSFLIARRIITY